jgi:RNA polymerase sigma-70 factor (ECF subfamily)
MMNAHRNDRRSNDEAQAQFLRLFLSSERELFRYIAALVPNIGDAEEIVQQTAVALWKKFDQYDAQQPFTPWACRFASNIVKQWAASRQRWQALLEHGLAEELANRREQLRTQFEGRLSHLDHCLEKLPSEQRGIVEAYYFRRQGIDVIAAQTRRSMESVYKALQRIRLMLRQCIERAEQTGEPCA